MKLPRAAKSLVARLLAFCVVVIFVGMTLRLVNLPDVLRSSLEDIVLAQQSTVANYVAGDIEAAIRARREFLEQLSRELPGGAHGDEAQTRRWLYEHRAMSSLFNLGLSFYRPDGRIVSALSANGEGATSPSVLEEDWFQAILHQADFALGRPYRGLDDGRARVVMAVPVIERGGRLMGVLAGSSELGAHGFLELMQKSGNGKTGDYLLVSPRDQMFVAATRPDLRLAALPKPGVNVLHDKAMTGWRGQGVTFNAEGGEELVGVASVPSADWFLVARVPAQEAFEPNVAARNRMVRYNVLSGAVILILVFVVSTAYFRPLRDAARRMRAMADGLEPLAPLTVVRQDEVGEMSEGFNYLLAKLRDSEQRMDHLAHHDALTGLPNRLALMDRLLQATALAQRQGRGLGLMFLDLDGFKLVNDSYGHKAGDQLLQLVAQRLRSGVRLADTVARLGGDEFVILVTDVRSDEPLAALAQKVLSWLAEPLVLSSATVSITSSIGIARFPTDGHDVDQLIAHADDAMYRAKRDGGNCYRFAAELSGTNVLATTEAVASEKAPY
jgi:diguanylate cyclase (GGDEF)-like protein